MWKKIIMELIDLKNEILNSCTSSAEDINYIINEIKNDTHIYPFNEYEYLLYNLISSGILTFDKYKQIRSNYINKNPYLWLFELSSPRAFGEKFAQNYILEKCNNIKKPSTQIDPDYHGQYDLWLNGIKIEVKASRAVDSEVTGPLYIKALSRNTDKKFVMNFQQLKPQYCDIFIWLAIFRDEVVVWIINSNEVKNNPYYSKGQHRGNIGNEGQLHIKPENINLLDKYEVKDNNIEELIYISKNIK